MDPKIQADMKQHLDRAVEVLRNEFGKLRTGRASVALLDGIRVEAYGSKSPLNQVASIAVGDSRTLVISPWDKSVIQEIEKAIHQSNIGLTPINDGKVIRINIPPLTEERRKDFVKVAKKVTEEARISIRNARRDANEAIKKLKVPEDDLKKWEGEVQKLTDQAIANVDSLLTHKEKEIMEV